MVGTTKSPYNLPSGGADVDSAAYNPNLTSSRDKEDFSPERDDEFQPIAARGADHHPTGRNFSQEDQEADRSEATGKIPRSKWSFDLFCGRQLTLRYAGEVDDLVNSATDAEKNVQGRTRGVKNDAWKQERELDSAMKNAGAIGGDEDF